MSKRNSRTAKDARRSAAAAIRDGRPGAEIAAGIASGELDNDMPGVAIYHEMGAAETFEETAGRLWISVRDIARQFPGTPRLLFVHVKGHYDRPGGDGLDADGTELVAFTRAALGPFLTRTPWGKTEDAPQREDLPDLMLIPTGDRMCILTGDRDEPVCWQDADKLSSALAEAETWQDGDQS